MHGNLSQDPGIRAIDQARIFFENERYYSIDDGIARKRPFFRFLFGLVGRLSRWRIGNAALIAAVILFYPAIRIPSGAALFQLGLSYNNERMFRQINEAAGRPEWNASMNGEAPSFFRRLMTLVRSGHLWSLAAELSARPAANPLAHTQLIMVAAAYAFYDHLGLDGVRLACISCDHSPIVMGLMAAARERGIRSCYVQHAPVADYFPPLDYDLSILFDRESAKLYARSAASRGIESRGDIAFLPPFRENFSPVTLASPPYRVGICLSYLFREDNLKALTRALEENPAVGAVLLRRHPACKASFSALLSDITVENDAALVSDFLDACDIVLVPNSGVTIECLHKGKPTFYVSGTDEIEDDYYGFVADAILPRFDPELLQRGSDIAAWFDADWEARFARYDATIEKPIEQLKRDAGKAFLHLVEP